MKQKPSGQWINGKYVKGASPKDKKTKPSGHWENGKFVRDTPIKKEKSLADYQEEHRQLRAQLDAESELYSKALETYELYKTDGDVQKAIMSMEQVLINAPVKIATPRYIHFLVDLYLKNNQNDRAWGYLNSLVVKPDIIHTSVVYREMAWLLKKEKRHEYSIEMIMRAYLWDGRIDPAHFNRGALIQDIGVSVRALKWTSETQAEIANFVEYQIDTKRFDESEMIRMYRNYYIRLTKE